MSPDPRDENPHVPGDHVWWGESWLFDFAAPDGSLGGYVCLGLLPNQKRCWYWACVVGRGRDLVVVADHHVPLPGARGLEIRADGLWADHIVEDPLDHVSVGCEAFGLRLEDPAEACTPVGDLRGERTPFGLDLGWETADLARSGVRLPRVPPQTNAGTRESPGVGYALPCHVVGEVLVGDESLQVDAVGWRRHTWGVEDLHSVVGEPTSGCLDDGTWFRDQADGLRVEPVATAPLQLPSSDGRVVVVTRTLCRVTDQPTTRPGIAWSHKPRN